MENETTTTTERMITHCGITALAKLWSDMGYQVYSNTDRLGDGPYWVKDIDLYVARQESGHDDWRALAWLRKRLEDNTTEKTRATAYARMAEAATKLGDDMIHAARIMRQQAEIAGR